ncbi:MAG: DUF4920 domain-containing protein [Cyclobacteriaceae bacterium]|nr:DUF4920 domain-containing protein [Cyclobacteriaceae bacterium]
MKKVISFVIILIIFSACNTNNEGESEKIAEQETEKAVVSEDGFYGEEINEDGIVEMSDFLAKIETEDSLEVKIKGTIEKTCKMKGCWMTVKTSEGETMRVSFKDYGFFVPKEGMEGKEVIIEGVAKKKLTSVQELKHFAQDGGATKKELEAITEDSEELTFVADGVIIKEVKSASNPE